MAVERSSIAEDSPQRDGRRWVTERHVHDDGREETVTYMAEADTDAQAVLIARAVQIDTRDANREQAEAEKAAVRWRWEATRGVFGRVLDAHGVARALDITAADAELLIGAADRG